MSLETDLVALALDIAREAGALAAERRAAGVSIAATKSSLADIVTDADREVEALIRARLAAERPDDGFLGEESAPTAGSSGITWVVDPIDGTVNYAKGFPNYAVSIAAVSGEPTPERWSALAGVVLSPMLGELFHAHRGGGAWLDGARLQVADDLDAGALLGTGFGYDHSTHEADLSTVGLVMPYARDLRRMGSAALDLAAVAAGRLDGYFERGLHPWDMAAGALLVQEAGGRVAVLDPEATRPMLLAAGPTLFRTLDAVLAPPVRG